MATPKKQAKKDTRPAAEQPRGKVTGEGTVAFAFGKENYRLLIIGLIVIAVGFLLMIGGGSDDPNVFSEDIFSFRRMTLAPILILAGYIIEIYAIMKKPRD
jgi:hypothetical protein